MSDLEQERADLREHLMAGEAVECPLCHQNAKIYKRRINATMATTLATMYKYNGLNYHHVPSLPGDTHEASQLAWWGLIEEESVRRLDFGRAGYWRVTPEGEAFLRHGKRLPKYARIYNGSLLNLDYDSTADISDALGYPFDFAELMSA